LKSVAAAEAAAMIAWRAIRNNDRVGGLIIGNDALAIHKPYRNLKPLARFLGDLSRFNQALHRAAPLPPLAHMTDALLGVRRLARSNYRIYFVSDFEPMGEHWRHAFRALGRRNEVVAIRVYDPLERDLPPADRYTVTDGQARWQFDAGDAGLRAHYRERFDARQAEFDEMCRTSLVTAATLSTDETVQHAVGWL
jgi:uncharacterized protein (DUF58 family)